MHVFVEGTLWSESPFNMERVRELFADGRYKVRDTLDEWATHARPVSRSALRCATAFPIMRS